MILILVICFAIIPYQLVVRNAEQGAAFWALNSYCN